MIAIGEIKKIEGNIAFVEIVEYEATYECFMMQPLTGKIKVDFPYSEGEQVVCILQDGRNIVIGAIYNDVDKRDSEAEPLKCLLKAKKITFKSDEETKMRAKIFDIANNDGLSINQIINRIIDEIMKIVVLQGTSPNVGALTKIKEDNNKLTK